MGGGYVRCPTTALQAITHPEQWHNGTGVLAHILT